MAYDQKKKDTWKSANRTLFRLLSVYIIVVSLLLLSLYRLVGARMSRGIHGNVKESSGRKRKFGDSWECKGIFRE
jgi:hypothetical protein